MNKKLLFGILSSFILSSCGSTETTTLYSWKYYNTASYDYIKKETDESLKTLLETHEYLINNQDGTRKMIPPGLCADYAYLLLKNGEKEKAIEMLKNEIALYPESSVFISRIIKKLEK